MSKLIFNGPVSLEMNVFVTNDETKVTGRVNIGMGNFEYPTAESIKERLAEFEATEMVDSLEGFRLMTKREAWDHITLEKTGETFALPGNEEWDELA